MTPEDRERTRRYIERLEARYGSLRNEVEADVASTRSLDFPARARLLHQVNLTAARQLRWSGQPRPSRDPPAEDFARIWRRLHAQYLEASR
jgi:hypothetical protein